MAYVSQFERDIFICFPLEMVKWVKQFRYDLTDGTRLSGAAGLDIFFSEENRELGQVSEAMLDEAVTLGGMLSVLIRARLPIAYVSDGQRVPEDLRPARAEELIATAVQLAQTNGAAADEDLLKRRFGDVAHALA